MYAHICVSGEGGAGWGGGCITLQYHHNNNSGIKAGNGVSHFNISFIHQEEQSQSQSSCVHEPQLLKRKASASGMELTSVSTFFTMQHNMSYARPNRLVKSGRTNVDFSFLFSFLSFYTLCTPCLCYAVPFPDLRPVAGLRVHTGHVHQRC